MTIKIKKALQYLMRVEFINFQ